MVLVKSVVKVKDKILEKKAVSWLRSQLKEKIASYILPYTVNFLNFNLFQYVEDTVYSSPWLEWK